MAKVNLVNVRLNIQMMLCNLSTSVPKIWGKIIANCHPPPFHKKAPKEKDREREREREIERTKKKSENTTVGNYMLMQCMDLIVGLFETSAMIHLPLPT